MGKFDLPATIDYVLNNTNHSQVHFIGHSQGAASFFVLTSERPEYNSKILFMVAIAPAVYMTYVVNPLVLLLSQYLTPLTVYRALSYTILIDLIKYTLFCRFSVIWLGWIIILKIYIVL